MKALAVLFDHRGSVHRAAGRHGRAIASFQKAVRHAPGWSVPWYNLGLTYKYMSEWHESYRCNAQAVRLNASNEAAIWNMGIAATALEDWPEARRAWALYGIKIPEGDGPPDMNLGSVPIRLNPDSDAEVVWARRIDPARALLTSIPLPESAHRHGDLILNDGAPVGYRMRDGEEVSVLNELALLASSGQGTFEVTITAHTIDDLVAFEKACEAAGCAAEDWSTMRILCTACSEGHPHEHPEPEIQGEHRFAIASGSLEAVQSAVSGWAAAHPHASAGSVITHLPPLASH